jgi:hypothetical protein
MGIPVNPATDATAEINPNLYISLEVHAQGTLIQVAQVD